MENRIRRKTFAAIDFINFLMDFTFSAVEDFNISDKYLCVGLGGWLGGRLRIRIRGYRLGTVLAVVVVTLSATESGLSDPVPFFYGQELITIGKWHSRWKEVLFMFALVIYAIV